MYVIKRNEVINMVKCPNCGSTAQVTMFELYPTESGKHLTQRGVCGCGARIEAWYKMPEPEQVVLDYVEKNP